MFDMMSYFHDGGHYVHSPFTAACCQCALCCISDHCVVQPMAYCKENLPMKHGKSFGRNF